MRVLVTGTRGIPHIPGGVETHCEAIYPKLIKLGIDVSIIRRSAYLSNINKMVNYKGIYLIDLYSPKKKSLEAIIHTFLAIVYGKRKGFKYIHVHAIGPSLVIPFARLLGLKVVMTHHGPDYDRQKWGIMAKTSLKLGEWCAAKFANEIIVISNTINNILKKKYNRVNAHLIPNGVNIPVRSTSDLYIKSIGLQKQNYIIAVGRFVPEKGLHDLIEAYLHSGIKQQLVLVGDADHESEYSKDIKAKAKQNGIVLTGFIKGDDLNEIYTHAALFVMPSYHEGLPIALLEALSYNLNVLVSDIPANSEVELDLNDFFKTGDINELKLKMIEHLNAPKKKNYQELLLEKYNWDIIANQTIKVYNILK
jgi:glycosyltransferase involved in cell wall biosynthesis